MLCGLYESDITPWLEECHIPGYPVHRCAAGVRDPLMVRAMAFENSKGNTFIYVNMDAIRVIPLITDMVRERVEQLTGVPGKSVMVSSTHIHTGGPIQIAWEPGSPEEKYSIWAARRAADTAVMAWNKRVPVRIGFGSAHEDSISFIRRYYMKDGTFKTNPGFDASLIDRPAGEIDPEVGVIKIEDMDGKLIGVLTNFACHCDTVGGYRYCADFPGELARVLKKVYGQELVSLFMTGACGNINHYDFMHRTSAYYHDPKNPHYIRMGRILAGDVIRALADIETHEIDELAVEHGSFIAGIRKPAPEAVAEAEAFLKEHPYEPFIAHEGEDKKPSPFLQQSAFRVSLLSVAEEVKTSDTLTIPMQTARIGNAAIAAMPCELFVEHGLSLKARSDYDYTFVSTVSNAHYGYVSVRESIGQGGYEATISGNTKTCAETGYDMVDTALRLFEKMK